MSKCIITGCEFIDTQADRWCHGDLHEEGDCWVFNACLENGETAWRYDRLVSNYRALVSKTLHDFFERRGVIVIAKSVSALNQHARDYLAK